MREKSKVYYLPFLISIGLLTLFLAYYLRFIYGNESDRVKQEVKLLFDNVYESEKNKQWEFAFSEISIPFTKDTAIFQVNDTTNNKRSQRIKLETVKNYTTKAVVGVEKMPTNDIVSDDKNQDNIVLLKKLFKVEKEGEDSSFANIKKILLSTKDDSSTMKVESFLPKGTKTSPKITLSFKIDSTNTERDTLQNKKIRISKSAKVFKSEGQNSSVKVLSSSFSDTIQFDLLPVNLDSAKSKFQKVLLKNNLPIQFKIDSTIVKNEDGLLGNNEKVEYSAVPTNNFWFIIQKIAPQISLSLFVLLSVLFGFLSMFFAIKKQEKLSIEKQQFLSNMTHELKTPLSIVGVALESIQRFEAKNNAEKRVEYVEIAQNENRKLVSLIDKILNFTKSTEEKLKLELVNPNDIITHVLNTFKPKIEDAKITINKDLEPSIPIILSNQEALIFILQNLIDNSIKYNDSQAPEIIVKTNTVTDGSISITVEDNGTPIPAEFREKIFDKFYRVKNDIIHNQKGFGLGLYIAKEYTNAIGGRLEYLNEMTGNCFCLTLPKK